MDFRRATQDDVDGWLALFEEVAGEGKWIGAEPPIDRGERKERFERVLSLPEALVLVAEVEGRVIGVLNGLLRRGVVDLGLIVEASWRGKGVGSQLLERCLRWAAENRAHKVFLEVWPHNKGAIELYKKFGFAVEGRLRRHYRRRNGELWDALEMGLVLDVTSPGSPY